MSGNLIRIFATVGMSLWISLADAQHSYLQVIGDGDGTREDRLYRVKQAEGSNALLIGYSYPYGGTGQSGGYVIKLDSAGHMVWANLYGGSDTLLFADGVLMDDGYIFVGHHEWIDNTGSQNFSRDIIYLKTDFQGVVQWAKKIVDNLREQEAAVMAKRLSDGNVLLATVCAADPANEGESMLLTKINLSGDIIWSKLYEFLTPSLWMTNQTFGFDIQEFPNSDLLVAGTIWNVHDPTLIWLLDGGLVRLDSSGQIVWCKAVGQGPMSVECFTSVQVKSNDHFVITGSTADLNTFEHESWLIEIKSQQITRDQVFNFLSPSTGNFEELSGILDYGDSILVHGRVHNELVGDADLMVMTLDSNWSIGNARLVGGNSTDFQPLFGTQLLQTPDGGFLSAGESSSWQLGATTDYFEATVAKFDPDLNVPCEMSPVTPQINYHPHQLKDTVINVYPYTIGPTNISMTMTPIQPDTLFLCSSTFKPEPATDVFQFTPTVQDPLVVYPNPARTTLYFKTVSGAYDRMEVYDHLGRRVLRGPNTGTMNVESWASGPYILKLLSKEATISRVFLVE